MAERSYVSVAAPAGSTLSEGTKIYKWTGLVNTDTGLALQCGPGQDITATVTILTGTGSVAIQGAIDPDPATTQWAACHLVDNTTAASAGGSVASFIFQVLEAPTQIRPVGTGTLTGEVWVKLTTSARRGGG